MENMMLALSLLLAGFIIVFVVLILLIIIITVYGKIIQAAQRSSKTRKEKKKTADPVQSAAAAQPGSIGADVKAAASSEGTDEIPGEIIAVIAAAVDAVYGSKPHRVRSVKRSGTVRSAWGNAGVIGNTRPF